MKDFYYFLEIIKKNSNTKFALATIINVDGSAYRREGAKMLLSTDGSTYGTISAGCLEEDLYYRACDVIKDLQASLQTYDLRSEDDFSWGQSSGCNGKVQILIEPFYWDYVPNNYLQSVYPSIYSELAKGENVFSIKSIKDTSELGSQVFFTKNGAVIGNIKERFTSYSLNEFIVADQTIESSQSAVLENEFFIEKHEPKDPLYIFGAGPDVVPLVALATQLEFSVTVIDPRSSRCCKKYFPTADHLIVAHPETYLQDAFIPPNSYIIIMTHNFNRDQKTLQKLIQLPLKYIGILGPRSRTERLLLPQPLPSTIFSPIGLKIGADGPTEISVSIMAELIKIRREIK